MCVEAPKPIFIFIMLLSLGSSRGRFNEKHFGVQEQSDQIIEPVLRGGERDDGWMFGGERDRSSMQCLVLRETLHSKCSKSPRL